MIDDIDDNNIGLIEDEVSVHVNVMSFENSLLETSNALINMDSSEAQVHTLPGLSSSPWLQHH